MAAAAAAGTSSSSESELEGVGLGVRSLGDEALTALFYSAIAGLSTGVGGSCVYCFTEIGPRLNSAMLGVAAGAM